MKRTPQLDRLSPEPLEHCHRLKCTFPVCHCYDSDKITEQEATELLLANIEPMLQRLRHFIDDLREILSAPHYYSNEQLKVYRKRKARLQKNFNFWKIRYDLIKYKSK